DMDLEADLGIDSIKRVEILAAMEERLPGAARIETDRVGALRTLRQVIEALAGPAPAPAAPAAPPSPVGPYPDPGLDRRVLRAVETALPATARLPVPDGHEIRVTDDGAGLASAIVDALIAHGRRARLVTLEDAREPHSDHLAPLGGLIVVAPPVGGQGGAGLLEDVPDALEPFLKKAFRVVADLGADLRRAVANGGALLATVARMDGAFGLLGTDFDPLQGGLAGLPRTAAHEWPGVACRALDVSLAWTATLDAADAVVRELSVDGPLEVGLESRTRRVLQVDDERASFGRLPVGEGDVVLVSGGGRGVTAACALALARAARPTMVLVGRSNEPFTEPVWLQGIQGEGALKKAILDHHFNGHGRPAPAELERVYQEFAANREVALTLAEIRAAGAAAVYHSVDVSDPLAVLAAVEEIRAAHGPIRGLIHGAGVLADRRLDEKTDEQFARVFDTKIHGLRHLLAAIPAADLRSLVLFSSVTARSGRPGQVDYCVANNVLNKVAQRHARRHPHCKSMALNWGPWDGGMVNDGLRREFARLGVGLIPLQGGAHMMVREMACVADAPEVMVGDGFPQPAQASPAFEQTLSLATHPFLDSHRIGGRPVLPLAMLIEWMGHAALLENPGLRFVGVDDLAVMKGIALEDDQPLRVEFHVNDRHVEVRGADGTVYTRARVLLAEELPPPPLVDEPATLAARAFPHSREAVYAQVLFHGPHLHAVGRVEGFSDEGMVASLASSPRPSEWMFDAPRSEWITDPLAIDGAMQLGLLWNFGESGQPSLPTGGARYRQYVARIPREGLRAALQVTRHASRKVTADVTLRDAEGSVVARCEGFEWAVDPSLAPAV
ncbi:MAG: SDR family NAD(P)-dependent oxidoreductase, partial [Actinobacteria bacterium]|nr:SDR family NAD(P)-dependent oxidoreductase [Actinomycetota bacterium]